jgi:hypothetical protein
MVDGEKLRLDRLVFLTVVAWPACLGSVLR